MTEQRYRKNSFGVNLWKRETGNRVFYTGKVDRERLIELLKTLGNQNVQIRLNELHGQKITIDQPNFRLTVEPEDKPTEGASGGGRGPATGPNGEDEDDTRRGTAQRRKEARLRGGRYGTTRYRPL